MALLEVENLTLSFLRGGRCEEALRGVSFTIERGEMLALVGESGSGKSVTALSLLRLLPAHSTRYGEHSRMVFADIPLHHADEAQLRQLRGGRIGMIFQEPVTSLNPFLRIGAQLCEAYRCHHPQASRQAARARALQLLEKVRIPDPEQRFAHYPHQFSGGQLQRIMIAMALMNDPDLLIADEPTTALDVTVQAEILRLLKTLQQEMHLALLFITHDLALARHYGDRVCVMRQGEIVESGDIARVFAAPAHPYTRELLAASPQGSKPPPPEDAPTLLTAEKLHVSFGGQRRLLARRRPPLHAVRDVSFSLKRGETLGIVGESGSGKSTLGRAVMQMLQYQGEVRFAGKNPARLAFQERQTIRAAMQIVFQDPYGSLSPRLTVGEIVGEGLRVHRPEIDAGTRAAEVEAILQEVALPPDAAARYPHEFSGGQRQRIAIARAVIVRPQFVLLDEPTSALDRSVQIKIIDLLRRLQDKHSLSYLFISHDLAVVRAMSDRVLVMRAGEVVESGTAHDIFTRPQHPYTQRLLNAALGL